MRWWWQKPEEPAVQEPEPEKQWKGYLRLVEKEYYGGKTVYYGEKFQSSGSGIPFYIWVKFTEESESMGEIATKLDTEFTKYSETRVVME